MEEENSCLIIKIQITMRSRSDRFFLCKVAMEEMQENGIEKMVTKQYAIDALTWSDAEARISEVLAEYSKGEMEIKDIRLAKYEEIFFSESSDADKWFSAKLAYITIDEKSGKEKRKTHTHLFQASSLDDANKCIADVMKETMIDFDKTEIKDSKLFDVIEYGK